MIKEIILNVDDLTEDEIIDKRVINKYVLISNNKVYLKNHHNTYFFLDDNDIDDKSDLRVVRKEYIKDYPFIGENTLKITNYYVSRETYGEGIPLDDVAIVLNEARFDNPRNQIITDEILEILNILLNNK